MSARKSSKLEDGTVTDRSPGKQVESLLCSSNCPFRKLSCPSEIGKGSKLPPCTISIVTVAVESREELSSRSNPVEEEIRKSIIQLTKSRGPQKSICPSEVCRKIFPSSCWRTHMPLVRQVGFQLADEEIIAVTQRNKVIPPAEFGKIVGPIRFTILTIGS